MIITSKFPGRCLTCSGNIAPGDRVSWIKGIKGVSHAACSPEGKEVLAAVEASRATDAVIEAPAPEGLSYLPYQRAGISYALNRAGSLVADEMGLGKTIQAIGVINGDETIRRVLVICPASLKLNWNRELGRWLVREATIEIVNGGRTITTKGGDLQIVIVNYDVLKKWRDSLLADAWDLVIVDEAHYCKNAKAQRT
jgi:SWI/SNF-related matrix-associated actin-dependent regulator 1 of chromatin subfamily A